MQKKVLIIGIIVLFVAVGLSGCNDIGLTNIGDLQANPGNYVGKEVKVKGTVSGSHVTDENGHSFSIVNNFGVSGKYYLTGIVESGTSVYLPSITWYQLNVTKVEAV